MKVPIPFTKYGLHIEKRGVSVIDKGTGLPMSFDLWRNKLLINNKTPILENIYHTIATEFSKIDLYYSKNVVEAEKDGIRKHIYNRLVDNPNYGVLALRPNLLQTKSELLYTIAYQLHVYGNAIVKIVRANTDRNIVTALEPLNMEDYEFGQGYEIGETLYLKLRSKETNKIILLDYGDTIHLRLNPNDFFYGDKNSSINLSHFEKIFDENLNALLNELKESGVVNGVVELGGGIAGGGFNSVLLGQDNKIDKQKEVIERIKATKGGVLVLDAGEKWTSLTRTFRTMSSDEVNSLIKYLYNFKGINQKIIDGTATEAENEIFFNKSIMPIIERLLEELNYKFLTKTARTQGHIIEYFKNPFEYMATKDLLASLYLGAMYFTQNEVRHMAFRLHPLPNGDVLMDNKNFEKPVGIKKLKGGDGENGAENT